MKIRSIRSFTVGVISGIASLVPLLGIMPGLARAEGRSGAVYILADQSTGNSVIVYRRAPDGILSLSGSFSTGGKGMGTGVDPLGSQGALALGNALGEAHRLLFAVNAGSNEISVFAVRGTDLQLVDKVSSGGTMPVSIAVCGQLVYVLNAGGNPNITGFFIDPHTGQSGSQRSLARRSAASPAQVSFSRDGDILVVTEKGTRTIDTYKINDDGFASGPAAHVSNGATPFGFAFTHRSFAIVSEAGPNALSSYEVDDDGGLELVTGSLPNGQKATCWVVATDDSRFAFTSNTASGTISSYEIRRDGTLSLLSPTAAVTGNGTAPTDMALSGDSRFFYVREGGTNSVGGFRVEANGSLTPGGQRRRNSCRCSKNRGVLSNFVRCICENNSYSS